MLYFDTSFLAPLVLAEETSVRVEAYVARLPAADLCISHWLRVEFASLLSREVRMGALGEGEARAAGGAFERMVAESFTVLTPAAVDFHLAKRFTEQFATGLRAGDALHLAIAGNHGAETFYTLDRALLKAAKMLGIPASRGIR